MYEFIEKIFTFECFRVLSIWMPFDDALVAKRKRVASALLEHAFKTEGLDIIADILCAPVKNRACLGFLAKYRFRRVGLLSMASYRDFGKLESVVLAHTP